jgi:hypothetical protein
MKYPMVASCCASFVGCKVCINTWASGGGNCCKCRAANLTDHLVEVKGLDTALEFLKEAYNTE